jgi:hypothetical protein
MNKHTLFIGLILLFTSCSSKDYKPVLVDSNGRMNQLLVVMDNNLWQGIEGDSLRNVTGERVLGLPQNEPQFGVTQVPVKSFGTMFKSLKNILIIGIGEKTNFSIQSNVYAKPQTIIKITGADQKSLLEEIYKRKQEIITTFKNSDLEAIQYRLRKKQFDITKLKTLENLGITMQIPNLYRLVDDTGDFLWMRQHIKQGQSMNLIVYELPINSLDDEEGKNIVSVRDTIGKNHIPGSKEGKYLITEQAYSPHTFNVTLDGKKAFETRGKWEMKNDFMAGPFLNYTVVDKLNNRLIVVEGFTYAPTANKRDYMFEIEAVLKTLKIKQ